MDLDAPCSVQQAAAWFGVTPKVVRNWIARYHLVSIGGRGKQAHIYRYRDLVEAERRARESSTTPVTRRRRQT
jgi:hypothetical protein